MSKVPAGLERLASVARLVGEQDLRVPHLAADPRPHEVDALAHPGALIVAVVPGDHVHARRLGVAPQDAP